MLENVVQGARKKEERLKLYIVGLLPRLWRVVPASVHRCHCSCSCCWCSQMERDLCVQNLLQ